jgi:NADP-dependent aldehyde dehydrogenase
MNKIFVAGGWRDANAEGEFRAVNPATGEEIGDSYPISDLSDIEACLSAAKLAAETLREAPGTQIAEFLELYAANIESNADAICAQANLETALPVKPRLRDVELPRTTDQLRLAARAARDETWRGPVIDTARNIRSMRAPLGPVVVFGPNNFPLAFNSISGGDFAAAIASHNPVVARAHPLQPGTSRLLCQAAARACEKAKLPAGTVQMLYGMYASLGEEMVRDPRVAAIAFTGSRHGGMALKAVADECGKPAYLEMSSVNPVVLLPGAVEESFDSIVEQYVTSALMGSGQFCTNPGLVLMVQSSATERFISEVARRFESLPAGTLFSAAGRDALLEAINNLIDAGAVAMTRDLISSPERFCVSNTLLRVSGIQFLEKSRELEHEAFGNVSMIVVCEDLDQLLGVIDAIEGQLTGTIYSAPSGRDGAAYLKVAAKLRYKVGRLVEDRMPTGVAVSPAMQHGGPYPSTGHPGFTSVGIPASIQRFTQLQCYDNVPPSHLPPQLRNENPLKIWRCVDGEWTKS